MTVDVAEDLYALLGVTPDATADELSAARRRQLRYWHPDRNRQGASLTRSKQINRAYDMLSDPNYRAEYDRQRGYSDVRPSEPIVPTPSPATGMRSAVPSPSKHTVRSRQRQPSWLILAGGLVAITVLGAGYLHYSPTPLANRSAFNSPLASTPSTPPIASTPLAVSAPASTLTLHLADVVEILQGAGWRELSGAPLVKLSAQSTAMSAFAFGSAPVQLRNQVLVLNSEAAAGTAYRAAVRAYPYPLATDLSIVEGQESSLVRSKAPVWRDPGPNGNFTGGYTAYNRYQFVLIWRDHNVVALISFAIDLYNTSYLQPLADRVESQVQANLG